MLEELIYVSPKSGRAVCREAGQPYHNKLLKLPAFLLNSEAAGNDNHTMVFDTDEITDGIDLCGYFLEKYFFSTHNITQPQARERFVRMMGERE